MVRGDQQSPAVVGHVHQHHTQCGALGQVELASSLGSGDGIELVRGRGTLVPRQFDPGGNNLYGFGDVAVPEGDPQVRVALEDHLDASAQQLGVHVAADLDDELHRVQIQVVPRDLGEREQALLKGTQCQNVLDGGCGAIDHVLGHVPGFHEAVRAARASSLNPETDIGAWVGAEASGRSASGSSSDPGAAARASSTAAATSAIVW